MATGAMVLTMDTVTSRGVDLHSLCKHCSARKQDQIPERKEARHDNITTINAGNSSITTN